MSKKALLCIVCAAILLSASAFAVDGVVLINQATVAGHFPYTITQSGSYRLSSNLVVPAGMNGIFITADNVTLDLNGFSIVGPAVCNGAAQAADCAAFFGADGITGFGRNITVRNGTIRGMGEHGVNLTATESESLVEEVHASNNAGVGILIQDGIIRRCTASENGAGGIRIEGGVTGVLLAGSLVAENVANSNRGNGIETSRSTVMQNTANGNSGAGLSISTGVFGSNTLQGNGRDLLNGAGISQNNNSCNSIAAFNAPPC